MLKDQTSKSRSIRTVDSPAGRTTGNAACTTDGRRDAHDAQFRTGWTPEIPDGWMVSRSEGQAPVHPGMGTARRADSRKPGMSHSRTSSRRDFQPEGLPAGGTSGKPAGQPAPFPGPWATQHPDVRAVFLQGQERTVVPEPGNPASGPSPIHRAPAGRKGPGRRRGLGVCSSGKWYDQGSKGWKPRRAGTPGGNSGRELRVPRDPRRAAGETRPVGKGGPTDPGPDPVRKKVNALIARGKQF